MTKAELMTGLEAAGCAAGMRLMVHTSMSSLGRIGGGAGAVIAALQETLGPEGTLLMPSFNHGAPFEPGGAGVYDPAATPSTNGAVPDLFRRLPGVYRSLNPTHAFAVWGRDAKRYTERHHETPTMGADSPLGLLSREGGWQLNLGTTHATSTGKHLAETLHRSPCLGVRTEAYPVRMPGGRTVLQRTWGWREANCPLTESGELIELEMERLGLQRTSRIGPARATLFRVADLVEAVTGLLVRGHGDAPPCSRCPVRPRQVAATVPTDRISGT